MFAVIVRRSFVLSGCPCSRFAKSAQEDGALAKEVFASGQPCREICGKEVGSTCRLSDMMLVGRALQSPFLDIFEEKPHVSLQCQHQRQIFQGSQVSI